MAGAELSQIARSISNFGSNVSQFRQASTQHNENVKGILKDVHNVFKNQSQSINSMSTSIENAISDSQDQVTGKINTTNSLLENSVQVQNMMLQQLGMMTNLMKQVAQNTMMMMYNSGGNNSGSGGGIDISGLGNNGKNKNPPVKKPTAVAPKGRGPWAGFLKFLGIGAAVGAAGYVAYDATMNRKMVEGPRKPVEGPGGSDGKLPPSIGGNIDTVPGGAPENGARDGPVGGTGGSTRDVKPAGQRGSASEAMQFFRSKGWTKEQAAGIVGNLQHESVNFAADVIAGKRKGDGGAAVGIAQWHPPRQRKFKEIYGKDLIGSTFQEQLEFVQWELTHTYKKAGDALTDAKTAAAAAILIDRMYEKSDGTKRRERVNNAVSLSGVPDAKPANSTNVITSPPTPISGAGAAQPTGGAGGAPQTTPQTSPGAGGEQQTTTPQTGDGLTPQGGEPKQKEEVVPRGGNVRQEQSGIRNGRISAGLLSLLQKSAAAAGVDVVVTSGGQPSKGGGRRTGSTRHDNGNAADLDLYQGGKKLTPKTHADVFKKFVMTAKEGGATGFGAGEGYMGQDGARIHVGYGKEGIWGKDETNATAADWLREATQSGSNKAIGHPFDKGGQGESGYGETGMGARGKRNEDGSYPNEGLNTGNTYPYSNEYQGGRRMRSDPFDGNVLGGIGQMFGGRAGGLIGTVLNQLLSGLSNSGSENSRTQATMMSQNQNQNRASALNQTAAQQDALRERAAQQTAMQQPTQQQQVADQVPTSNRSDSAMDPQTAAFFAGGVDVSWYEKLKQAYPYDLTNVRFA